MENHKELTLAYVNGYRAAKGLDPLDEFPENVHIESQSRSMTCPIARALGVHAYAAGFIMDTDTGCSAPDTPDYVIRTEAEFDRTRIRK